MSTMNRLANCKNQYQGDARKVLCVCSAGLLRSPTTARVLAEHFGYNTRAAGISEDYALIPVDEVLIEWADEIVCMEQRHANVLLKLMPNNKEIVILDIPDNFAYMDDILVALIKERYGESLDNE